MRRMLLGLFFGLCILPVSSQALSFFSVSSAEIRKVDAYTYRLQVRVTYGGFMASAAAPDGTVWASEPSLCFTRFEMSAPSTARNFFFEDGGSLYSDPFQTNAAWQSVGSSHTPGTLGRTFGFDFEDDGTLENMSALQYSATLEWSRQYLDEPVGGTYPQWGDTFGPEQHKGSVTAKTIPLMPVAAVPEPATLTLMGMGLAGLTYLRRRK